MPVKYRVNGKDYTIPDNVVSDFENDNPDARVLYTVNEKNYAIPLEKREAFLKRYPDAVSGKAETPTAKQDDTQGSALKPAPTMEELRGEKSTPKYYKQAYEAAHAEPRPGLREMVNPTELMFAPLNELPVFNPTVAKNGMLSTDDLGQRLKKVRKEGGMESFAHLEEDAEVDALYTPKKVESERDILENYQNRFKLTERGAQLDNERAEVERDIVDKYYNEFQQSDEYKKIANGHYETEAEVAEANKALNDLFLRNYGEAIGREMAPYEEAFNSEMLKRYGSRVNEELTDLAKKNNKDAVKDLSAELDNMLAVNDEAIRSNNSITNHYMRSWGGQGETGAFLDERRTLNQAKKLLEESQNIIDEAGKKGNTNFVSGLARGFWDNLDAENFTFGLAEVADMNALYSALNKAEKGEELTQAEEKLLEASTINMATQAYYGSDLGRGYKAGQTTAVSLPFMLSFIANPISGSGNALAKGLLKYGLKRFGHVAATKGAKFAGRLIGDAGAALGMMGTTELPRVVSGAYEQMARNYDYNIDESGNMNVEKVGDMSFGKALGKSATKTFFELQSEMVFNAFKGAAPMLKAAEQTTPGGLNGVMDMIKNSRAGQLYRQWANNPTMREIAQRAQFHGIGEEYLEEVYNNFANIPFGDMTAEEALDLDNNIDTFLGLAPTSAAFAALGLGSMAYERADAAYRKKRIAGILNEEQQQKLAELEKLAREKGNEDIKLFIKETIAATNLTPEEKAAEIEYAYQLAREQAINEVDNEQVAEREQSGTEQGAAIYASGDRGAMRNAVLRREVSRERLQDYMSDDDVSALENADEATRTTILESLEPEARRRAEDYLEQRAVQSGLESALDEAHRPEVEAARQIISTIPNSNQGITLVPLGDMADDTHTYGVLLAASPNSRAIVSPIEDVDGRPDLGTFDITNTTTAAIPQEGVITMTRNQALENMLTGYEADAAFLEDQPLVPGQRIVLTNEAGESLEYTLVGQIADGNWRVTDSDNQPLVISPDQVIAGAKAAEKTAILEEYRLQDEANEGEKMRRFSPEVRNLQPQAGEKVVIGGREGEITGEADGGLVVTYHNEAGDIIGIEPLSLDDYYEYKQSLLDADKKARKAIENAATTPVEGEQKESEEPKEDVISSEVSALMKQLRDMKLDENSLANHVAYLIAEADRMVREVSASAPINAPESEREAAMKAHSEKVGAAIKLHKDLLEARRRLELPEREPIPTNRQGRPLYHLAPVDDVLRHLAEEQLEDYELDAFIAAQQKEASDNLAKLTAKAPKMGTDIPKYKAEKAIWQKQVDEVEKRRAFWNEVEVALKKARKPVGQDKAEEILQLDDAMTGEELAAKLLAQGRLPLLQSSYMEETGYGRGEVSAMFGLFRSADNGGMTVDHAAELLALADEEEHNGRFFGGDSEAARNTLLSVLSEVRTTGGLNNYIKAIRAAQAKREQEAEYAAYEQSIYDMYGVSVEEYEAREEQIAAYLAGLPITQEQYTEFINTFADEINRTDNERASERNAERNAAASTGSSEVLYSEQSDNETGVRGAEEGSKETDGGSVEQDGTASAEDAERRSGLGETYQLSDEVTPIGVGDFGNIYDQFRGKPKEAIAFLTAQKSGEAIGALSHPEIGEIDLVWGEAGTSKSDGFGLAKLVKYHPEVLDNLQEILNDMKIVKSSENRVQLESDTHQAAVRLTWNEKKKKWLLTAFEKKNSAFDNTTDTGETSERGKRNDTATSQNTVSANKGSEVSENDKETGEKVVYQGVMSEKEFINAMMDDAYANRKDRSLTKEEWLNSDESTIIQNEIADSYSDYLQGLKDDGTLQQAYDNASIGEKIKIREAIEVAGFNVDEMVDTTKEKQDAKARREEKKRNQREELMRKLGINPDGTIAAAEAEVNTEPTEAQKKAGNYKMGHVKLFGFDVTIENPKGSERKGVDASGKSWSVTMNNTYGYIRGTEGVDGDHIDVFLSDHTDDWNGQIFVIDQVNSDGSFDEHKVMIGFNSLDEARENYLKNYSEGWTGLGSITEVGLEEFRKWVDSSHRKTKAFAEYKSVRPDASVSAEQTENESELDVLVNELAAEERERNAAFDAYVAAQSEQGEDSAAAKENYEKWLRTNTAEKRAAEHVSALSDEELEDALSQYKNTKLGEIINDEINKRFSDARREQLYQDTAANQGELPQPGKTSPYTIQNYTSKDEQKPALGGVHHENGLAIASDGFVMVGDAKAYDKQKDGKTFDKKGNEIDVPYPNWKAVRDVHEKNQRTAIPVDWADMRNKLLSMVEAVRAQWQAAKDGGAKTSFNDYMNTAVVLLRDKDGGVLGAKLSYLVKFVQASEAIGAKAIEIGALNNALMSHGENGSFALLMPVDVVNMPGYSSVFVYEGLGEQKSEPVLNDETPISKVEPTIPASPTQEKYDDFGEKIGAARKDTAARGFKRGEGESMPSWKKKYKLRNVDEAAGSKAESVGNGYYMKAPAFVSGEFDANKPFVVVWEAKRNGRTVNKYVRTSYQEGYQVKVFNSMEEYETFIPVFELSQQNYRIMEKEGKYVIYRLASNNKRVEYAVFDTKEEATAYMNSPEGATSLLNKKRENFELPALEKLTRTIPDYRQGKDVTPDILMETFGFRGGEFGNWLNAAERQQFLNYAYDALLDLSHLLGVSPRALSLGGELSIAFGARGKQGAAAHYEPGRAVINLTKMNGAGSLAHEWAHALDNYFGLMLTGKQRSRENLEQNREMITEGGYGRGVREEVRKAFSELMRAIKSKVVDRTIAVDEAQADVDKMAEHVRGVYAHERERLQRGVRRREYNRKTKKYEDVTYALSEAELTELDGLVEKLLNGEFGWEYDFKKAGYRATGATAERMYELIKKIESNTKGTYGPMHNLFYYADKLKPLKARLEKAKSGEKETARVDTDVYTDSKWFDKGRVSPYFSKEVELFARAFEAYLVRRMADTGDYSDYLTYEKGSIYQSMWDHNPYPAGEELTEISKLFDNLFSTMQEKVEDGKTILFQVADEGMQNETAASQLATAAVMEALHGADINVVEATDEQVDAVLGVVDAFDKQKALDYLHLSAPIAEASNSQELNDAAKVIKDFENPSIEAQIVYHGSGAAFDRFDHRYMGTGEGAQAFGWGTYVTQVEGIAKGYAEPTVNKLFKSGFGDFYIRKLREGMASGKSFEEVKQELLDHHRYLYEKTGGNTEMYGDFISDYRKLMSLKEEELPLRNLYEVEIPENDGKNYLSWYDEPTEADKKRIIDGFKQSDIYKDFVSRFGEALSNMYIKQIEKAERGEQVYMALVSHNASENAPREASEFLSSIGYVGIEYPTNSLSGGNTDGTKNYAIFNEADLQIQSRVEFLREGSKVYGWTDGSTIYLTKAGMNPNTPIHEYTHLWARAMMQKNPQGWDSVKSLMKGTPVWNEVMADENYASIREDEDAVASEALSRISGSVNAAKMEQMAQQLLDEAGNNVLSNAKARDLINRMKRALQRFWNWVGVNLFGIEKFESVEQVTDRVLYDLVNQTDLGEIEGGYVETQIVDEATNDIRYRQAPTWKSGDVVGVTETFDGFVASEGLSGDYPSKARLLDAFRNKYPQYFAELDEAGNIVLQKWSDMFSRKEPSKGKPLTKKQQRAVAYAEREANRRIARVEAMAEQLGIKINIVTYLKEVKGRKAKRAKGWYDVQTGEITILMPNHTSMDDVMRTVLHEAVAHHGLRKLFGEQFDTFLDNVYEALPAAIQSEIIRDMAESDMSRREAVEEYLARLAEDTNFENAVNEGWFEKVKQLFLKMLAKVGFRMSYGETLTDNDLRYILWRSYDNLLHPGLRNPLDFARDLVKQQQLGVNGYEAASTQPAVAAETVVSESATPYSKYRAIQDKVREFKAKNKGTGEVYIVNKDNIQNISVIVKGLTWSKIMQYKHEIEQGSNGIYDEDLDIILIFEDNAEIEKIYSYLWHETSHRAMKKLSDGAELTKILADLVDKQRPNARETLSKEYDESLLEKELAAYFMGNIIKKLGSGKEFSDKFLASDANKAFTKIINYIVYGEEGNPTDGTDPIETIRFFHVEGTDRTGGRERVPGNDSDNTLRNRTSEVEHRPRETGGPGEGTTESSRRYRVGERRTDRRPRHRMVESYDKRVSSGSFNFQEAFQDSMLSLKILMDEVVNYSGKPVQSFEDAYTAENRMSSLNKQEAEKYMRDFFEPLLAEIKSLTDEFGETEVERYIYAKSGLERNEVFVKRDADAAYDKDLREIEKKWNRGDIDASERALLTAEAESERRKALKEKHDYSGLREWAYIGSEEYEELEDKFRDIEDREKNHKISPDEADRLRKPLLERKEKIESQYQQKAEEAVAAFEAKVGMTRINELWKKINAATNETLRKDYASGMLSKEQYEDLKEMMKYYVPMRGWDGPIAENMYNYSHKEAPITSNQKKAEGRSTVAFNPIANIAAAAQNAIVRGNRNKMKQRLFNFVVNRPNPLVTVGNVWYVRQPDGKWKEEDLHIPADSSSEEIKQIIEEHEERMKEMEKAGNAFRGKKPVGLDLVLKTGQSSEHAIPVMINGEEYLIYVNADPRAAQAVNGQTNSATEENVFWSWYDAVKRYYGGSLTSNNPDFVIANFVRDSIHSSTMTFMDKGAAESARFMLNVPKAAKYVLRGVLNKDAATSDDPIDVYFREFVEHGGETGYTAVHTVEDWKREYDRYIKNVGGIDALKKKGTNAIKEVAAMLEVANRIAEDINRFNAYLSCRQSGLGIEESVNAAKNITVNFNKKGSLGKGRGAWSAVAWFMNKWILFFNPTVQGVYQIGRSIKNNKKRAAATLGTVFASGFLMPFFNELLVEAFCGDDDEKRRRASYWNQTDYNRMNNWMIYNPFTNGYIRIPLPPTFRELYGMGDILYRELTGRLTAGKAAYLSLRQLQAATGAINILPSDEPKMYEVAGGLAPDILAPMFDVAFNRDFSGRKIAKTEEYNKYLPEYERIYKGVNPFYVGLSKLLNEIGGSDAERNPYFGEFINPAFMQHIVTGYTGGIGKTITNITGAAWDFATGNTDNIEFRQAPVVNRFYTPVTDRTYQTAVNREYRELLDEYNRTSTAIKRMEQFIDEGENVVEWIEELDRRELNGEVDYVKYIKDREKELKKLTDRQKEDPNDKELANEIADFKAETIMGAKEILENAE